MPSGSPRPIVPLVLACLALLLSLDESVSRARRSSPEPRAAPAEPALERPTLAAPPPNEPVRLRFAWPEAGRVRVRAEHRRDERVSEEAFELHWRPLPAVGSIVEAFPLPGADFDPWPPGFRRTSGTLLTPVQAVIRGDGRFVCTPHLDELRALWSGCGGHRLGAPVPEPLAERWDDWVERWIGLALAPGETRTIPDGNERGTAWIRCLSLDAESVRLRYRMVRPRLAPIVTGPWHGLYDPSPAADELGCELERTVEAELLHAGLRPREVRSWWRWTWARGTGESARTVRVVEHESRFAFDWSQVDGEGASEVACSPAFPEQLESWAGRVWRDLGAEERREEAAGWRSVWDELVPPRKDQLLAAVNAGATHLGPGLVSYRWWREERPALHRLWRVEYPLASPAFALRTWLENGPPESSVDVLFVSEGYTAEELAHGKYWKDVERVARGLFEDAPLSWYRDCFNVRVLSLESRESGCDPDPVRDDVATALDACFTSGGAGLRVRNEPRLREILRSAGEADAVFVMVNADDCRGTAGYLCEVQTSRDFLPFAMFSAGCEDAHETAAHELGHAFAELENEYVDESGSHENASLSPRAPNVTLHTSALSSPWRHFLELPGAARTSWHHEGAFHQAKGFFRAWPKCRMSDEADPFCPVCCEAVARAIFRKCGLEWNDAEFHRAHPLQLWLGPDPGRSSGGVPLDGSEDAPSAGGLGDVHVRRAK